MSAEINSDSEDEVDDPPPGTVLPTGDSLPPSTPIYIRGMKDEKELNGQKATVISFQKEHGRFIVKLDKNGTVRALLPAAILLASDFKPPAPKPKPKPAAKPRAADDVSVVSIHPPGTVVSIRGLRSKPALNGRRAVVESFNEENGRFSVALDSGEVLALRPESLLVVGDATAVDVQTAKAGVVSVPLDDPVSISDPDDTVWLSRDLNRTMVPVESYPGGKAPGGDTRLVAAGDGKVMAPMSHAGTMTTKLQERAIKQLTPYFGWLDDGLNGFEADRTKDQIAKFGNGTPRLAQCQYHAPLRLCVHPFHLLWRVRVCVRVLQVRSSTRARFHARLRRSQRRSRCSTANGRMQRTA